MRNAAPNREAMAGEIGAAENAAHRANSRAVKSLHSEKRIAHSVSSRIGNVPAALMKTDHSDQSQSRFFNLGDKNSAPDFTTWGALNWQEGRVIDGKFEIVSLLGEGGMGTVYEAFHLALKKTVALKTFRANDITSDALQRFQREAQAIGRLNHINVVQVYDFGFTEENFPYYTMECLAGQSLADYLAENGALSIAEVCDIFAQVCEGLSAVHSRGIIHRDLKPGNIFLAQKNSASQDYTIKIVDFGLATLVSSTLIANQKITSTGTVFGSPLYMSPEQASGIEVSPASDVYSCGCALFESLVGEPPFLGTNAFATIHMHMNQPPPSLRDVLPGFSGPQRLEALLQRMLAKEPGERPQDFSQIADQLRIISQAAKSNALPRMLGFETDPKEQDEQPQKQNPKMFPSRIILPTILVLTVVLGVFWVITVHFTTILKVPAQENSAANQADWDGKPFRQPDDPDHPGCAVFYFPVKRSLGTLEWKHIEGGEPDMTKEAIGKVIGPSRSARLHFEAGELIQERPDYFSGFGSNDIDYLKLKTDLSWSDKHLKHIGHMSNLLSLTIQGGYKITDACIETINKLTNLQDLIVPASGITDSGLCQLDRLHQFTLLDLSNKGVVTKTILKLSQNSRLRNLYLDCCEISDDDVNNMCKISSLETISVNFCPFLTDKSLVRLFKLPNLIRLDICGTKIAPRELSRLLRGRHQLKELKFGFENFSEADGKEIVDLCNAQHIIVKFETGGQ
jgi:serine/threonine protein kinase